MLSCVRQERKSSGFNLQRRKDWGLILLYQQMSAPDGAFQTVLSVPSCFCQYQVWQSLSCKDYTFSQKHWRELKDCIRNTTAVCNPRQNSIWDKFTRDKYSPRQNSVWKKNFRLLGKNSQTAFCLGFPVHFFELSWTIWCLSSLSGIYIPQLTIPKCYHQYS